MLADDKQTDLFGFSEDEKEELMQKQKAGLPPSLRKLITIFGYEGAYQFLQKYAGIKVYVPLKYDSKSALANEMTQEQFRAFIKAFNPTCEVQKWVALPKGDKMMQKLRNQAIQADTYSGLSARELAQKYKLTSRQIHNILKDVK